ncbi:MAG TPA: hypothetical protein DEH78_33070, partial [Solibacterales bacterium]|nr:hypothetical protein [Bryobacterales bacterium]
HHLRRALALLLLAPLAGAQTTGDIAVLQIRVLEGEGASFAAGSKSARLLTVQVSDETGKPIPAVAVSFRLPDEGPTGLFSSGLRTEVVITAGDGRASVFGVQWNKLTGPLQLRVTAARGGTRAGLLVPLYLAPPSPGGSSSSKPVSQKRSGGRGKAIALTILVAAAGGGAAVGLSRARSAAAAPAPVPLPPGASTAAGPTVGNPSITVGRP